MSLFKYGFKRNSPLPLPNGPLSREIPVAAISAANDEVTKALQVGEDDSGKCMKRRGPYQKYTDKEKAEIGKYAMMHGATASLRHFKDRYSELKYTTICEWKKAIATEEKKIQQPVTELKSKKRGRPSMLPDKITTLLMKYIHTIRDAGGIINTAIVIAAGLGIVKKIDPGLLECNDGHVVLQKSWAKYLLNKMDFVKRKATTKKPKFMVSNFEELKDQFLMDIKAIASMEDIPNDMIVNWDQTAIKYIPLSNWTMAKEGSKRVEVAGIDDKRQITATFAASLSGNFLPVQMVYEGKTTKCHPSVKFPEGWHITHTPNHWCNEDTMVDYIAAVIVPYMKEKRKHLGLDSKHVGLVILDEFKGQTTNKVLNLLQTNDLMYVIVPPNCTDRLQPLDVSVNRAAKQFLRNKFENWYADQIIAQKDVSKEIQPVDMRMSIVKPVSAKWMISLYNYFLAHPQIIKNGFKNVGITDFLAK